MSNPTNGPQRAKQHADRLDWLRMRPALLAQLPGTHDAVDRVRGEALDSACRQMMHVQLYSPNTRTENARRGIQMLVSELRGESVPRPLRSPTLRGARS